MRRRGAGLMLLLVVPALVLVAVWMTTSDQRGTGAGRETADATAQDGDEAASSRRHVAVSPEGAPSGEDETPASDDAAEDAEDRSWYTEYGIPVVELSAAATTTLRGIVVTHEGRAVPGAEVTARSTWMTYVVVSCDPETPTWTGTTRTDARGRFELRVALGGPIEVVVASPDRKLVWTGRVRNPHEVVEVMLPEPGDLDIGGNVVDEEGSPVPGAHVYVVLDTRLTGGRPLENKPVAFTDADGRWSWTTPVSGRQIVRIRKDGYAPARPWVHIAAPGWDERPETVLQRGVRIRGIVLDDETERPVEGARLVWNNERSGVFAHTARDGTFELHVTSESVSQPLTATADGYVPRFTSIVSGDVGADSEPVTLRLQRPGTLRMRCIDEDGQPVDNVTAIVSARSSGTRVVRAAVASYDGYLTVEGLPPAPADVSIVFQVRGVQVLERVFPAPAARGTYDAGDVVLPSTSVLRGTLVRSDGAPATEGWVVAAKADPADPGLAALADAASSWDRHFSRCDAQGRFALPGLTPGVWDLLAWGRGLPPLLHRGVVVPAEGAVPELSLRMPPPLRLRVRVVDADGGPVGDVGVVVWREHPLRFGYADGDVTDEEGRAAFDGFAPDVPRVWVEIELPGGDRGAWVDPRAGEAELRSPDLRERDPDERP